MDFVNEGWENGPTSKRELMEPGKIKKDNIFIMAYGMAYFLVFVIWELLAALFSFLWRLIVRPEPKSLKGRVCLVTGSGRGLGREFCLALAKEGAVIACADINEANNKTTAEMVQELGAKAVAYKINVAIKKDVEELVSKIEKDLGPVYLLINNAAVVYSTPHIDEEFIRASFNVNVMGPIWLTNAVLPTMKMRDEGHIVNISSLSSKIVMPPLNIYGATKCSMAYFGECVRAELLFADKNNIFVTNVHPTVMNSSEDYLRCTQMKVNMFVEMEEVVKATMDAIHYNYDEVIIPPISKYPLILITEMMPSRTSTKLMKLVIDKWNFPNREQTKCLPWGNIIKESSLIENNKDVRTER
ncbi:unnamed protein product [Nezara viridula]|uniref:Uncharacterized protein n=1 Tax=Nezara viridula TaxID=85310 RepID=A0A9P0EEA6_NEZVI|nr:unnamed protein product [Nezara viridula]